MSEHKEPISSGQLSIADDQTEDHRSPENVAIPIPRPPLEQAKLNIQHVEADDDEEEKKPSPEEVSPYEKARLKFQKRLHSPPTAPKSAPDQEPGLRKWKSMKIGEMIEQRRPIIEKRNRAIQQDLISIFDSKQEQSTPASPGTRRSDMMMDPVVHKGGFDTHHPLMFHETEMVVRRRRRPEPQEVNMSKELDSPVSPSESVEKSVWEKMAISHTSSFYQTWKPLMIILNFVSSAQYLYYGTFFHTETRQDQDHFDALNHFYIMVFAVDTFIHLFLTEALSPYPFNKILAQRLRFQLPLDLLSFLPLHEVLSPWTPSLQLQKLYLLKTMRLYHGLILLDSRSFKRQVKDILQRRLKRLTQRLRKRKTIKGFTKLSIIVLISQMLKTAQLVVFLLSLSYFTGLLWYNYCTTLAHFDDEDRGNFISAFNISQDTNYDAVVKMTYFAFTTLSTVGLGDFFPVSEGERVLGSFIMLFGVLITTLLMNNLASMLVELKEFNKAHDESEKLAQFIGTLTWFNEGDQLDPVFTNEVEQYFRYRWQADRNIAVSSREDLLIMSELPGQVKTSLYMDYLFKGFLDMYKQLFFVTSIRTDFKRQFMMKDFSLTSNPASRLESLNFYGNDQYRDILVQVLSCLEPVRFMEGQHLFRKGQTVSQVYFPMNGQVEVGYNQQAYLIQQLAGNRRQSALMQKVLFKQLKLQLNEDNKQKFCFPVTSYPGLALGFFEVLFDIPATFYYKVKVSEQSQASGSLKPVDFLFLRGISLGRKKDLLDSQNFSLIQELKINVVVNFSDKIYFPIQDHKQHAAKSEEKAQEDRVKASVISIFNRPREAQEVAEESGIASKPNEVGSADEVALLIQQGKLQREQGVTKKQLLMKLCPITLRRREQEELELLHASVEGTLNKIEQEVDILCINNDSAIDNMVDYIIEQEETQEAELSLLKARIEALKSDNQELSQKVYDLTLAKQDAEHRLLLTEAKFKSKIEKVKKKSSKKVEMERNNHLQSSLMLARNFAIQIKRVQSNSDLTRFQRQQLSPTSRLSSLDRRESNNLSTSKAQRRIEIQKVDSPDMQHKNLRPLKKESFHQKFNRRFSRGPGPSSHHDSARVLMGASRASNFFQQFRESNQMFGSQNGGEPDDCSIDMPSEFAVSKRLFSVASKKKETDLVKEELDDYQDQLNGANLNSSSVSNHSSSKHNSLDKNKSSNSKSLKSNKSQNPSQLPVPSGVSQLNNDKIEDESLFLRTCKEAEGSSSSSSVQGDSKSDTENYAETKKSQRNIFIEYSSPEKTSVFRSTAFPQKKSLLQAHEGNDSSKESHREEEKDHVPIYAERKIEPKRSRLPYHGGRLLHHGISQEVIPAPDHLMKPAPHASGKLSYFNLRSSQGVGQNTVSAATSVSNSQDITIRQSIGQGEGVCLETSSRAPSQTIQEDISIQNSRLFSQTSHDRDELEMSAVKEKTESSIEEELLCEDTAHQGSSKESRKSRWGKYSGIESGSMCNFQGVSSSIAGSALQGIGSSSIAGSAFQRSSIAGSTAQARPTTSVSGSGNQGVISTSIIGSHGPVGSTSGMTMMHGITTSSMLASAIRGAASSSIAGSALREHGTNSGSKGTGSQHPDSLGSQT